MAFAVGGIPHAGPRHKGVREINRINRDCAGTKGSSSEIVTVPWTEGTKAGNGCQKLKGESLVR